MTLGMRPRPLIPLSYKTHSVHLARGVYYGIPRHLDPGSDCRPQELWQHPALLRAASLPELEAMIDEQAVASPARESLGSHAGYDLVRYRGAVYAIPQTAHEVDLDLPDTCRTGGVLVDLDVDTLRERIDALAQAVPVEFTGWLPIVSFMGNCGQHPQFLHTTTPPSGYRFTRSAPPKSSPRRSAFRRALDWLARVGQRCVDMVRPLFVLFQIRPWVSIRARLRLLAAVFRLYRRARRAGGRIWPTLAYLRSRSLSSQMLLAENRGLLFLASAPYTLNQNPWVIEVEDPTTLFYPFVQNGMTCDLVTAECPVFPIVRAQLEDEQCRAIITHIRSTARMLPRLFQSEAIAQKVFHVPLGVTAPARWQRHDEPEPEHINLLFINSWCQVPGNLYVRGGLDILEAFAILRERYPQVRLTLRTQLPDMDDHFHRLVESGWVRVINRFLTAEEMETLHAESHIFLLPAARIHIVSLLQAMAAGLAVVTSDGWGIREYVTHERNGLIVEGRYGVTSWADEEAGILRENYTPCYTVNPEIVRQIVESVSRLIEDPALRRRLGRTARQDIETTWNLENWNHRLKEVLDKACGNSSEIRSPRAAVPVESPTATAIPVA